jgi:hypothetical protein
MFAHSYMPFPASISGASGLNPGQFIITIGVAGDFEVIYGLANEFDVLGNTINNGSTGAFYIIQDGFPVDGTLTSWSNLWGINSVGDKSVQNMYMNASIITVPSTTAGLIPSSLELTNIQTTQAQLGASGSTGLSSPSDPVVAYITIKQLSPNP